MKKIAKLLCMCLCLCLCLCLCSCATNIENKTEEVSSETMTANEYVWAVLDHIETPEYPKQVPNGWIVLVNDEEVEIQKTDKPIIIKVTKETLVYEEPSKDSSVVYTFTESTTVDAYAYTNNNYWVIPSLKGFIQK